VIVLVCLESPSPSLASRAALRLACGLGDRANVVVLSVGDESAGPSFELARRSAAVHRIVHLQDPTFKKAGFFTLGMVLAEAARHLEARVILAGQHSDGEGQGMVPAALAYHLKAPLFARVGSVQLPASEDEVLHLSIRSGGRLCKVESPLPVVLTIQPSSAEETSPLPESTQSSPAVETLSLAQLGIDASRLVPRPDLLGTHAPAPTAIIQHRSFDEAAHILLRG
jgi:electron transfer flavoprotein beta subunit